MMDFSILGKRRFFAVATCLRNDLYGHYDLNNVAIFFPWTCRFLNAMNKASWDAVGCLRRFLFLGKVNSRCGHHYVIYNGWFQLGGLASLFPVFCPRLSHIDLGGETALRHQQQQQQMPPQTRIFFPTEFSYLKRGPKDFCDVKALVYLFKRSESLENNICCSSLSSLSAFKVSRGNFWSKVSRGSPHLRA